MISGNQHGKNAVILNEFFKRCEMREIKFRAMLHNRMLYLPDKAHDLLFTDEGPKMVTYHRGMPIDAGIIDTLMQYTGLKDKNGKEIYEGDILKVSPDRYEQILNDGNDLLGTVVFIHGCWYLDDQVQDGLWDIIYNTEYVEIIGNIYETPELLKEDE